MFSMRLPIKITQPFFTLMLCLSMSYVNAQDTIMEQSFDFPALFPPVGWTNTKVAGVGAPGNWARVTTGGSPIQEPHSDPAEAKFNSYFYQAGTAADLASSVVDLSVLGTYTVNFWMYRDGGNGNDKMEIYVNTTQASAGGTLIGTIYRKKSLAPVEATDGWYNYTFTIPAAFNTATNYIIFKGVSDYGFNIFLDDIAVIKNVVSIPTCGTGLYPVTGATDICPNLVLSWDNAPYATGYKITLGNNAPNYNNVANNLDLGNVLSYSVLLANSTTYKWKIRPYNENGVSTGCIQNSFTTASGVCYCTPVFIEPNCVSLDYIDDVSTSGAVTNISNLNTNCAGGSGNYSYYSALTIDANQGSSFTLTLQSGPDYEQGYGVWADWNRDGDFDDADEFVYQSATPTTAIVNAIINVPVTAALGVTRFRIRAFYNEAPLASQACATWNEGETEDYNINVTTCTFTTYYQDADNDGFGTTASTTTSCTGVPPGYSAFSTDCNDAVNTIYPGAIELCNLIDDNCNGTNDDNAAVAIITPAGATSVCKGSSLILNANTGIGYTYQWIRNGANLAGATSATYNVTKSGNYSVKVTVPGGCNATSTAIGCTVNANPTANISTPEGTNLCGLPDLDLVANGGAGFTYIWYKNGAIIAGATNQTYVVTTIGDYRVKVFNAAGCSKTSPIKTVTTSCKTGDLNENMFSIQPNPSTDATLIQIRINNDACNLVVTDVVGKVLFTEKYAVENNLLDVTLQTANYPSGLYFVTLITETGSESKQLVVIQ